jgi:hypothetical protein
MQILWEVMATNKHRLFLAAFIATIALFVPSQIRAQVTQGSVFGTAKDPSGAVIPEVTVTVRNEANSEVRSVKTDATGQYQVVGLTAGSYRITATKEGFNTIELPGVTLVVGQNGRYDVNMAIGTTTQTVTVASEQSLIETTNATISSEVSNQQVVDLPLNGRSFLDLAQLAPGVALASSAFNGNGMSQGKGPKISINGANTWGNLFYLDGTLMNDAFMKTPGSVAGVTLGVDTINQFTTYLSTNGAELGGTGGVIDAITKSGTNTIRGDAFFFYRDKVLNSRDFFDAQNPPPFTRKQFGGTVGGPIKRDKLFLFLGYEGFRQVNSANQTYTVPDFQAQQGFLPNTTNGQRTVQVNVAPVMRNQVFPMWGSLLPTAATPDSAEILSSTGLPIGYDKIQGVQQVTVRENYYSGRLDYQITNKDSLFARYTFDQGKGTSFSSITQLPNYPELQYTTATYATIRYTRILGANAVNTLMAGYTRPVLVSDQAPTGALPPVSIPGVSSRWASLAIGGGPTIGGNAIEPFLYPESEPQVRDDFTRTIGKHTLKIGGAYSHYNFAGYGGNFASGSWTFSNLSNFLQGIPNTASFNAEGSSIYRNWNQWYTAAYVSDQWKTTSRLTMTFGLRYEYASGPTDTQGREAYLPNPLVFDRANCVFTSSTNALGAPGVPYCPGTTALDAVTGSYWPASSAHYNKDFQPRYGLAWDVQGNGKTVVRAGFGIYETMILQDFYDTWRYTAPFTITATLGPPNTPALTAGCFPQPINADNSQFATCNTAPNLNGANRYFEGDIKDPTMYRYNFLIERQLGADTSLSVGYVGAQGRNLARTGSLNLAASVWTSPLATFHGSPTFPGYTTAAQLTAKGCPAGGCAVAPNVTVVPNTPGNCYAVANNCTANPNIGGGTTVQSFDGLSTYNSLQVSVQHHGKRLFVQGSYVFSKSLDEGSATHGSDFIGGGNLQFWQNPSAGYARSSFDVPHRLAVNSTYNLPGPAKGFMGHLLGGWEATSNLTLASGPPFTLSGALPNNGSPYELTPGGPIYAPTNFLSPAPYVVPSPGQALTTGLPTHFINIAAISSPMPGTLGGSRNTFPAPGLIAWNASLLKTFKITEGKTFQVRIEGFNVLNHANFQTPSGSAFAFGTQSINGGNVQVLTPTATYAQIGSTIVPGQGGRQIQIGGKFVF